MIGVQLKCLEFREDLWYRINTVQIDLPPLRYRKEDIIPLAKLFMEKYALKYKKTNLSLAASAEAKLISHSWPGNIRELKHAVEKAVILCEKNELSASLFAFRNSGTDIIKDSDLNLENLEKKAIRQALKLFSGNMTKIAGSLGITRPTLYAKMKKYEL